MTKTALSLAFLLALCLVAPLHAQPVATDLCPAVAQPAADSIDLAQLGQKPAPQLICQQCPLEYGEICVFEGQGCSFIPGCSCQANLVCCR